MLRNVLVLCFLVGVIECRKLPSYITACKKTDPNLNKCAMEHAIAALPSIMKGDKAYKYPRLEPFHLESIDLKPTNDLSIKLKDITLSGIKDVQIKDINIDLDKRHILVKLYLPSVNVVCQYSVDGRILVLPINGNGPGNMTFDGLNVDYMFDYNIITKKDGKKYIDPNIKPTATFTVEKSTFDLKNLFNGDKNLGDHMNQFLNENHKDVAKDLGSSVSETINAIATQIIQTIVTTVAYDDVFL